ncbi:DUSAM domain-containing protein [Stigmatella aurantiaca]|uniref:DUSAM domain-containing protein n=1 Tax=Stigmatella aurantiaca TaxID=41 RepID=UPI000945DA04|nr:DUSAM domain-containing protein [Stigmatella aurantiaca]
MSGELNWNDVRELAKRVLEEGGPLLLSDEVRAILRRTAREVAIDANEAEQALRSEPEATALLREMARRIRDGSHRLSRALAQMYRLRERGDLEGARQQMREVLTIEVVPHYRDIAETSLEALDAPDSD